MASYKELYNKIHGENTYEENVKGEIGRKGLKAIEVSKKVSDKVDKTKETIKNSEQFQKAMDVKDKVENSKPVEKVVKPVVNAGLAVATKPASFVAGTVPATAITAGKNAYAKAKYKDNPEKLERELKKNIKQFSELKSDCLAVTVWSIGFPIAVKTLGIGDNIFKGLVMAGAAAAKDKELTKACAKALVWQATAAVILAKLVKKFKNCKNQEEYDEGIKEFKTFGEKLEDLLKDWAESDEPLFVPMRAKYRTEQEPSSSKKGTIPDWKFNESVLYLIESYIEDSISEEEFDYLLESVVGDYDYQYEAYL